MIKNLSTVFFYSFKKVAFAFYTKKFCNLCAKLHCSFEKIVKNDREDGIIDKHLYPLARNEGGDYFYWDVRDENVYMIYCDDVENPVWVCDSIKAFFDLMENNQT